MSFNKDSYQFAGQTPHSIRLLEIKNAVADGASEIDIVISRCHALQGNWREVYKEVKECREACGDAHLKTIIATGELGSLENVYKASMVSMMAGSDFIKTSTGKEGVNAIFPVALVMVRCIREYFQVWYFDIYFHHHCSKEVRIFCFIRKASVLKGS